MAFCAFIVASAQSVDVYHSGILSSYSYTELTDINLNASETSTQLVINKTGKPLTIDADMVKSVEFSDKPVDACTKYADDKPAQVVFSCIEVNNVNPLQHLNFKLEKSNKYYFDAVILFSSNINFSKKEDVVYIHNNENVQPILNNWEHYIKPLKDRGIKVLLSILGNHDGSGLANLDDERAQQFAKAIADTLDKYDLDGVFFDDEYSEYNKGLKGQGYKGFLDAPSYEAASRLAYETKKAIGRKRRWQEARRICRLCAHRLRPERGRNDHAVSRSEKRTGGMLQRGHQRILQQEQCQEIAYRKVWRFYDLQSRPDGIRFLLQQDHQPRGLWHLPLRRRTESGRDPVPQGLDAYRRVARAQPLMPFRTPPMP